MALKLFEKYGPDRADTPTTAFPQGSIKNESVPGANDGTPLDKDWGNDYTGFDAALLAAAGITANGNVDTAVSSQRLTSFLKIHGLKIPNINLAPVFNYSFEGMTVRVAERNNENDGGAVWDTVLTSSVTPNNIDIIQSTSSPLLSFVLRKGRSVNCMEFGTSNDQTTDDSLIVQRASNTTKPYTIVKSDSDIENFFGKEIAPESLVQNFTSGRLYNPKSSLDNYFFGRETLQHWFGLFAGDSNVNNGNTGNRKIVCTGDSTTFGVGSTYGGVPAILKELAKTNGYANVEVINNGRSGDPTVNWPTRNTSWQNNGLNNDIAENPDLLIVRWGANDPYWNVEPANDPNGSPVQPVDEVLRIVIQGYRDTLTTLRNTAGMGVEDLSIIIATPGPMNDVFFGRDEVYFQRLSLALRQVALDFQCAYIDIYGLYSNSWGGVGDWYDSEATSGTPRAIHPLNELYEHIAGAIASICLPDWGLNWKVNGVRVTSATDVNRLSSNNPNLFFGGYNLDRMGDGEGSTLGRPYNGAAVTQKQADGATLQLNFPLDRTRGAGISARIGFNSQWTPYYLGAVYFLDDLGYQNGWSDVGSGFELGSYKLSLSGTVELSGVISVGTTTDNTVIAQLPVGFIPSSTVLCLAATEDGDCLIQIDNSGNIRIFRFGSGGNYICLNSVKFSVY